MRMIVNRFTRTAILACAAALTLHAQFNSEPVKQLPPPAVNWTQQQDQQNMMNQLGIKTMRPGPSGDESAPVKHV